MRLALQRLAHAEGLPLPSYQTRYSAGLDLCAAIPEEPPLRLLPGERLSVPTGLVIAVPEGYEGQVRARSGRALREGLAVLNAPGTIDSDFRGEVRVLLINLGPDPIEIARGERIAQMVIAPVCRVTVEEVTSLETTDRGAGGFGSTGR
ncbi:MAG: dUTP diphosphatase [Deltaproteobacteria bacterium]|nr:dUTP diphosphatase [Deltaproteobacteria bacterium]MBP6829400.1 dUTP diphosphatase [Deltaproteobacteria bacterium]